MILFVSTADLVEFVGAALVQKVLLVQFNLIAHKSHLEVVQTPQPAKQLSSFFCSSLVFQALVTCYRKFYVSPDLATSALDNNTQLNHNQCSFQQLSENRQDSGLLWFEFGRSIENSAKKCLSIPFYPLF